MLCFYEYKLCFLRINFNINFSPSSKIFIVFPAFALKNCVNIVNRQFTSKNIQKLKKAPPTGSFSEKQCLRNIL